MTPAPGVVEVDEVAVLPNPVIWTVGWFSGKVVLTLRFQMGDFETTSVSRPMDGVLKVPSKGYG